MEIKDLKKYRITPDSVIKGEDVLLSYKGAVLFSANNISTITGPPKSLKTALKDVLCQKMIHNDENFKGEFKGDILVIDTEQSMTQVQKSTIRLEKMIGDTSNILFYTIKPFSVASRIKIIDTLIKEHKPKLVIIDGTRDLTDDINNQDKSTYLITKLMNWVSKYKLHIINVVHTNPGSENVRGAIGTELINKSETVLCTSSGGEGFTNVKPLYSRDVKFDRFSISLDEDFIPTYKEVKNSKR